ncbi:hypothetical protein ACTWP4_04950 [Gracilibacillus sp. D59]|uniref:hypothetical protein n=1 Tax=Gracilibacillus sp. D59 TaxID=3457434 RepID=UPI003FCE56D0
MMKKSQKLLQKLRFPVKDAHEVPSSSQTFDDGGNFRIEIPSVEGAATMKAVIEEAKEQDIHVNRVSQGSGIMLLSDQEIKEMVAMGREQNIEVCLFVGPRMAFDTGASGHISPTLGWRHAGIDQISYALEDIFRAIDLGINSILVADEGLLHLIGEAKKTGDIPEDFIVKVSALMSPANPVSGKLFQDLGGTTLNIPGDLSLAQIAAFRQTVDATLDMYVESPDNLGGFIRYYEIPEIVRVASPIMLKFGLRNAANIYPSGQHLESVSIAQAREKVKRAAIGLGHLQSTNLKQSKTITY